MIEAHWCVFWSSGRRLGGCGERRKSFSRLQHGRRGAVNESVREVTVFQIRSYVGGGAGSASDRIGLHGHVCLWYKRSALDGGGRPAGRGRVVCVGPFTPASGARRGAARVISMHEGLSVVLFCVACVGGLRCEGSAERRSEVNSGKDQSMCLIRSRRSVDGGT